MSGRCPACGASAAGKFCSQCGASMAPQTCRKCGSAVAAGARFCASCGTAVGAGMPPATPTVMGAGRSPLPFAVAGGAVLDIALVPAPRSQPSGAAAPQQAEPLAAPQGRPPDLSQMTPREAFDRLFTRVMTAWERGDSATANRFTPMALMAYGNLPDVDIDARYDAALIHLHGGSTDAARALADT